VEFLWGRALQSPVPQRPNPLDERRGMFGSLPVDISTFGGKIDGLIFYIYALTGFFFVVILGYMAFAMVKFRKKDGVKARYFAGEGRAVFWILVLSVLILALDLSIDYKSAPIWELIKMDIPAGDVNLRVEAKQFEWNFHYPAPDGSYDGPGNFVSLRELHVPVNKKIRLLLVSADVIHSFFIPSCRLKQDVMPGRQIPAWFEATQTGTYDILCAEICGFGHTRMTANLVVQDQKDYDDWLAAQRNPKP